MDITYSQMRQLTNFSNDKMVDIIKNKIAESENAAVALVFDDELIVLNENTNDFYTVKYKVEDKALKLTGWEKVNLKPDDETKLESVATDYFNPLKESEVTVGDIVEAFKLKFSDEPVRRLINETYISKKKIVETIPKIKALKEVRRARADYKEDIEELFEDEKIKALQIGISENGPIQNFVSKIDFRKPISVSLFEEASSKIVSLSKNKVSKQRKENVIKKVKNLWTSESFKEDFSEFVSKISESDNVKSELDKFIDQHKEILLVSESELEDLIIKTTLMIGEAENTETINNLFKEYVTLDEVQKIKKEYIERNNINEEDDDEADYISPKDMDGDEEEDKEDKKDKKESTIDEDSINNILKVLNKIKEQLEDKTLENKFITSFIATLEDAKVGSIAEGKLKEILDFLGSIYEEASKKEEE